MITRDDAKRIRAYLKAGGIVYPGLCRAGSFALTQLQLDREFDQHEPPESEAAHG